MLYLYSFDQFAGFDRVFAYQWDEKLAIWDLVSFGENLFLVLWEKIAFPELYTTLFVQVGSFSIVEKSFFSEKYIELLHWMVYYWYSNYKTVIKLFFEWEALSLVQRKGKINKKTKKIEVSVGKQQIVAENSQILVVFPDLWTRENYLQADKEALLLNSLDTSEKADQSTKDKAVFAWYYYCDWIGDFSRFPKSKWYFLCWATKVVLCEPTRS